MGHYASEMNDPEPRAEQAPKEEWLASFNGFTVHQNPNLANGWIELRDENGDVIARVNNVKAIHVARHRR